MAACNYKNDDCNDSCMYGNCRWQEKANMLLKEYEDTDLTPEQIKELKERDTAKAPIKPKTALDAYYHEPSCPNCGREFTPKICGYKMSQAIGYFDFCPWCGQRLKREDRT